MILLFAVPLWPITTPALLFDIPLGTYSLRNVPDNLLAQLVSDLFGGAIVLPLVERSEAADIDGGPDAFRATVD